MKLKTRFLVSFFGLAMLIIMVGVIGWWAEDSLRWRLSRVTEQSAPTLVALGNIRAAGARMQEWALSLSLFKKGETSAQAPDRVDGEAGEDGSAAYERAYTDLRNAIATYQGLIPAPRYPVEHSLPQRVSDVSQSLYQEGARLIDLAQQGVSVEQLVEQNERLEKVEEAVKQVLDQTIGIETARLQEESDAAKRTVVWTRIVNVMAVVLGLLLAGILGLALTNAVLRPVHQLVEASNALIEGRYGHRANVHATDELGFLATTFNKMAETLQEVYERLKGLLQLRDELIAKVSHELRTPMSSIKEGVNLVLEGKLGPTTAEQRDFLAVVDQDIDRLTQLATHLLDISKIEAGRMRLYRQRTIARPLLELVVQRHRPTFGRRTVFVQCDDIPPVFVDSGRLLQVLSNLLSNAIKFTQEDGTIILRGHLWGDHVALAVQDDGPGIVPEDLPKLFQKFSQVGPRDPNQPKGTGLGLVVSKELVELHKGHIDVTSERGVGSTFRVLLPKYSDAFALTESFQELSGLTTLGENKVIGVIMVEVGEAPGGQAPVESLIPWDMAETLRKQLHKDDVVLDLQPPWIAILTVTTAPGLPVIVERLSRFFNDARLRFGTALHPTDGTDIVMLVERAKKRCKGLA